MAGNSVEIRVTATGAEAAAKILQSVADAGASIGRIVPGVAGAESAMGRFGETSKRVFEIFTGVSLSNIILDIASKIAGLGQEAARLGEQAARVETAFRLMTQTIGVHGDALIGKLAAISRGLASESDIMRASAQALQAGLDPSALTKIMEIAVERSRLAGKSVADAYNEIANAVATGRTRMLKDYQIVIDSTQAEKDFAEAHGGTARALTESGKALAYYAAMVKQVNAQPRIAPTDDEIARLDRYATRWRDFMEDMGKWWLTVKGRMLDYFDSMEAHFKQAEAAPWLKTLARILGLSSGATQLPVVLGPPMPPPGVTPPAIPPGTAEAAMGTVPKPEIFNRVQLAMDQVEQSIALLNARQAAGQVSAAEYEAALRKQIATLQALGNVADPEVRLKIVQLQGQLLKFSDEQIKAITGAFGDLSRAVATLAQQPGLEAMFPREKAINELLTPILTGIDKARAALQDLKPTLGAGATAELVSQFDAGTASLKNWAQGQAEATMRARELKEADAALLAELYESDKAWVAVTRTGGEAVGQQLEFERTLTDLLEAETQSAEAVEQLGVAYETKLSDGLKSAQASLTEVEATLGKTREEAERNRIALATTGKTFDELGESAKATAAAIADFNLRAADAKARQAFVDDMQSIEFQARVLGPDFDAVAAAVEATKARLIELGQASRGQVTPEIEELRASLTNLVDYQKTKALFTDLFSSIGNTFEQMVAGILTGTQTIGEAFRRLAQNIIVNFVNRIIQEALNPLVKAAAAAVAGLLSSGGPSAALASGGGTAGSATGAGGAGGGFNVSGIPFVNPSTLANLWTGLSNLSSNWAAGGFSGALFGLESLGGMGGSLGTLTDASGAIWDITEAYTGATSGLIGSAGELSGTLSGLSAVAAYAGAVIEAFSIAMDFANGQIEKGIGGTVGAVAGGVIGGLVGTYLLPGIGTYAGAAIGVAIGGWLGELIGGLFGGGPSHYQVVREKAQKEASEGLKQLFTAYEEGLMSGKPGDVLKALGTRTAGGKVRTELRLPETVAEQLGVTGPLDQLGRVIIDWSQLTEKQFLALIKKMEAMPEASKGWIVGSGDVGYLPGESAQDIANRAAEAARQLVLATGEMIQFTEAVDKLDTSLTRAAKTALSPEMAASIKAGLIDPLKSGLLDLLKTRMSTEEVAAAVADFQKEAERVGQVIDYAGAMMTQFTAATDAARVAMSEDLYAAVKANFLDPLAERMAGILASGDPAEVILKNLQALQAEQAAVAALIGAYGTIRTEIAAMSGDLGEITREGIGAYQATLKNFDEAIDKAWARIGESMREDIPGILDPILFSLGTGAAGALADVEEQVGALERAGTGTTPEEEIALIKQLHDLVIARYEYERQAIAKVEEAIAGLVKGIGTPLADLARGLAAFQTSTTGSVELFRQLGATFLTLAQNTNSLTLQLWAVQQGIATVIAGIQAAVAAAMPKTLSNPTGTPAANTPFPIFGGGGAVNLGALQDIGTAYAEAARPFIGLLEQMAGAAAAAGDIAGAIGLLQQEQAAVQALGAAAIQSVKDWAAAAVQAVTDAAAASIAAVEAERDAKLAAIDAEIEQNNARLKSLRSESSTLQTAINQTKQWEAAVRSIAEFIANLQTGGMAPVNPADQFRALQGRFAEALAAYRAAPSAEGLQGIQSLAQSLLQSGEALYSRPSPEYQALFAEVIAALQDAQATAAAQITEPSEVMIDRLTAIQAELEPLQDATEALQDQRAAIQASAATQIEAITTARDAQIKAINLAADAEIEAINAAVGAKLTEIGGWLAQGFAALIEQQEDMLDGITGGRPVQEFLALEAKRTIDVLNQLGKLLATYLETGSGPPWADVPSAQAGLWDTGARPRLVLTHPREMILPASVAATLRKGGPGASGLTLAPGAIQITVTGSDDPEAVAKRVRRELEKSLRFGALGMQTAARP